MLCSCFGTTLETRTPSFGVGFHDTRFHIYFLWCMSVKESVPKSKMND